MDTTEWKAELEKVAQEILGGPGRVVAVEYISQKQTFEVKVEMQTGIVNGPHKESYTRLDDERNEGNSHLLRLRLETWRDSGLV